MDMRHGVGGIFIAGCLGCLVACGGSSSSGTTSSTGLKFNAGASFTSSASASLSKALYKTTTGVCADLGGSPTTDDPAITDGLDCDADGGIVAHITPSAYAVAFKSITLVPAAGSTAINIVADTGTLANSEVITFTTDNATQTVVTINPSSLTAGTYTGVQAEIYYIQMTFPVAGTTRNVRIYVSDDDFAAEGSLGHHQGDITFVSDAGVESGWVDSTWTTTTSTRSSANDGAGGTDAETGHARGFFGNAAFWNATAQNQGATQDDYSTTFSFPSSLTIPDPSTITTLTTVTVTFSTADTFYYEDFAPQGTGFFPASGGEATSAATEWAPLAPDAAVTVSS